MKKTELTGKVLKELYRLGADVAGVASSEAVESHGRAQWQGVKEILPGAKNVLVFGVRMIDSTLTPARKNIRLPQFSTKCLYEEMDRIAFNLSRYLNDLGYQAIPYSPYLPVEMGNKSKGLIGDISHRHTAYEAGLGTIGKSRLLITERFGPRVRLLSIVTDAPLKSGKRLEKEYCRDCDQCINACPVSAILPDGSVDVLKCARENMKLGLPGVTQFVKGWVGASNDERLSM